MSQKAVVFILTILILKACGGLRITPAPSETPAPIPTVDRVIFNPPVEVNLMSTTSNFKYILAGDTIRYLTDYEKYNVNYNNSPRLRRIYDEGYAYYLAENTTVLLLEFDGDFAKIQLISGQFEKKTGNVGWIRKSNIRSYPKPRHFQNHWDNKIGLIRIANI